MKFLFVFLLTIFAVGSVHADSEQCTEERADTCIDDLLSAVLDDATEEEVCRQFRRTVDCLKDAVDECPGDEERYPESDEGLEELDNLLKEKCASYESGYVRDAPEHLSANLGEDVILRCNFEFPENEPVPYVIQWQKQGIKMPIYIWYDGYPPHAGDGYEGRVSLAHQASLNLTKVRESDQGWYECKVYFLNRPPDSPKNGTWVHLDVHDTDSDSIMDSQCFEENQEYFYDCMEIATEQALVMLLENVDVDEKEMKCALFRMITHCALERIGEKCGESAAAKAREELAESDIQVEFKKACEIEDDLETSVLNLLNDKRRK